MARNVHRLLCLLCLAIAPALACGGHGTPQGADALSLRAGDSLFAHLDAIEVREHPESVLPAEVRASLRKHVSGEVSRVRIEDVHDEAWSVLEDDEVTGVCERLGLDASTRGWSLDLAIDVEAPLGRVWIEHEGRRLRPVRLTDTGFDRHWADDEGVALFAWKRTVGELAALCARRPGELRVGFDRATEPDLLLWELRPTGAPVPDRAADLLHRVTLDRRHRPALAVSAPARLALHVDDLQAEALE
ncbi:MAG: hypothetical protein ACYTG2_01095 [Planctomycetota bacterium]|jgi:hypothetical protein